MRKIRRANDKFKLDPVWIAKLKRNIEDIEAGRVRPLSKIRPLDKRN